MKRKKEEIFTPTYTLQTEESKAGYIYFEQGKDSTTHLWRVYNKIRSKRGGATNEEQDILRAMLVMAGATLDVTVKNCVGDILHRLLGGGHKCVKKVADLINRKTLARMAKDEKASTTVMLVEAILDNEPRKKLLDIALQDIAGNSIQSIEMITRVYDLLQLDQSKLQNIRQKLIDALDTRNLIIHELDCLEKRSIKQGIKIRRPRKKDEMLERAVALLKITYDFLEQADKEILSIDKPN